MSDSILIHGDQAVFQPAFGNASVVVAPGLLAATGGATKGGMKLCVSGDELLVMVPGCSYTAGSYSVPGVGTLMIQSLAPDQLAVKTKSAGRPVLLRGSTFTAAFLVQMPAQDVSSSVSIPDSTPQYTGSGSFVTSNLQFLGT